MTVPHVFQSKKQVAILSLGFFSTALGIWTMLQTKTLYLPPWFLVLVFLPITILASLGFGFLVKTTRNSNWHTFTFAAMFMTGFALFYCLIENLIK